MAKIEFSKVQNRDIHLAFDEDGDEVAKVRRGKSDEEWSVELTDGPNVDDTFTSATAAKAFIEGFYLGKSQK